MSRGGRIFLCIFATTLLVSPIFLFAVRQQKADATLVNTMSEVVNTPKQEDVAVVEDVVYDEVIEDEVIEEVEEVGDAVPVLSNVVTPKIIDVGTTAIEVSFYFEDPDRDITEVLFETTEFFYKTGATNFYNSDFRPWAEIENMECVSGALGSCVIRAQFVGGLGWRDVFSGRLQLRDSKGHESKMVPFHVAIGTQQ